MRTNFEQFVQQLLEGESEANKKFRKMCYANIWDTEQKLSNEEMEYLEAEINRKDSNAITYYIKGCLCEVRKDYTEAIEFYEEAIELGCPYAMNNRAMMHKDGRGGSVNHKAAIVLYDKAIEHGNDLAMNNRAMMHKDGRGSPVNYGEAIRLLERGIQCGNTYAMYNRAFMHKYGQGDSVNHKAAIALYDKAIEHGNDLAMYARALMHEEGRGGSVNHKAAIVLYDKAIEHGNPSAMNNRAMMHKDGRGSPVNYGEAIRLLERGIQCGNTYAMYNRAFMHEQGEGCDVDYVAAAKLYRKAALIQPYQRRHLEGLYNLKKRVCALKKDSIYDEVAYHYAAATNRLISCLKKHPNRIKFFYEDPLLTPEQRQVVDDARKPIGDRIRDFLSQTNWKPTNNAEPPALNSYLGTDLEMSTVKPLSKSCGG